MCDIKIIVPIHIEFYRNGVFDLLLESDDEFMPSLSARQSTADDTDLRRETRRNSPTAYLDSICSQDNILALLNEEVIGLLSYITDGSNICITTAIVKHEYRSQGICKMMLKKLVDARKFTTFTTRSWSSNAPYIAAIDSLGFSEYLRIRNHNGNSDDMLGFVYHTYKLHSD